MPKKKIELNEKQQELYSELKKLSKRANQRLVRLEREFGKKDSWASKNLRNRLDVEKLQAWTDTGRIRVNKSMSITQMRAIIKATEQFLNSKTSTLSGIKHTRKNRLAGIAKSLGTEEKKLTNEEAETLYDMLADDYVRDILKYIPPSEFWAIIEDAKENHDTEQQFIDRILDYIEFGNDLDMIYKLKVIYEKYVA